MRSYPPPGLLIGCVRPRAISARLGTAFLIRRFLGTGLLRSSCLYFRFYLGQLAGREEYHLYNVFIKRALGYRTLTRPDVNGSSLSTSLPHLDALTCYPAPGLLSPSHSLASVPPKPRTERK